MKSSGTRTVQVQSPVQKCSLDSEVARLALICLKKTTFFFILLSYIYVNIKCMALAGVSTLRRCAKNEATATGVSSSVGPLQA